MLTFGKAERYGKKIHDAFFTTMWFTSFVTGTDGVPSDGVLRERMSKKPAVYVIGYRDVCPPSHPELERVTFGLHGGSYLYVGKAGDAWRRFGEHRITLCSVCWPGGPELRRFWYFAMPVEEEWQIHSFEALVIDLLQPIFNDLVKGLGAGGSTELALYLGNPATLSPTERVARSEIKKRVADAVNDVEKRPSLWFVDELMARPESAKWFREMTREE
jgi:hypothetical protein